MTGDSVSYIFNGSQAYSPWGQAAVVQLAYYSLDILHRRLTGLERERLKQRRDEETGQKRE